MSTQNLNEGLEPTFYPDKDGKTMIEDNDPECPFEPGDIVHLNSGGPDCTIESIQEVTEGGKRTWKASCTWFELREFIQTPGEDQPVYNDPRSQCFFVDALSLSFDEDDQE